MLRAVAVMQIPVDDRDARHAARAQRARRHRHVVVEAEPHGAVALGVVPGRTHERHAVAHLAREHGLAERQHAAGRIQ